jgi:hypothetical protein
MFHDIALWLAALTVSVKAAEVLIRTVTGLVRASTSLVKETFAFAKLLGWKAKPKARPRNRGATAPRVQPPKQGRKTKAGSNKAKRRA